MYPERGWGVKASCPFSNPGPSIQMNIVMANKATAKKRGRPCLENPLVFQTVGLSYEDWQWLKLWLPGGNVTNQINELISRSKKFWPKGPDRFR
jgi:hypothetical protein